MKKYLIFFCFLYSINFAACNPRIDEKAVTNLRCEFLSDPLGIDVPAPLLSWEIVAKGRGVVQTSYRILVASSPDLLKKDSGDLWNSGKISSDLSVSVKYNGVPLKSRTDCYWKVKVWTNKGEEMESAPAHWSMGLLDPHDWSAEWTGLDSAFAWEAPHAPHTRLSARYFRKEFITEKKVKKAVVYICGLGTYQLFINGDKIGDAELSPDPTQYQKRVFYNTYDVTNQIEKGRNAIATVLGNGRFFTMRWGATDAIPAIMNSGFPKMLLQLEVTYDDGSVQRVVSDSTWKATANGPIVANNEFDGEVYDASKEMPGWNSARFDDSKWMQAHLVEAPGGKVVPQMNPLIRIMDTIHPRSVFAIAPGKYIVDMGQNMVGWAQLNIDKGKKGDTVSMRFAERINPDSTLYTANLRGAEATDHYIMKKGSQQWEPHFTYHGFRYIEITGYPGEPEIADIIGKVVYDGLTTTGHFETSNDVINQIYHNAYWGIRGNYRGMPTDCPQRDERMGWLGDRAVGSYGESFIFDNNKLYAKWLQDIEDAQREDGSIPDVAPTYWSMYSDNMTWPAAYVIIANMLYHQFDNQKPIEKHYLSIKKWLAYMREKYMKDYIMTRDVYGDWCMPPEDPKLIHSTDPARITPGPFLGTSFYYRMVQLMEHFATLLHKPADQHEFNELAANIKKAFNEQFYNDTTEGYVNNTATANIFALAYDLAPDSLRSGIFQHVVNTTLNDFHGHISTGLVGAQQLMRTLTNNGRPDIAYQLATNTTYPSWGYMAKEGATTIWELWNGNTADPAMNSGNHVMLLGDLIVWFYEDLAGIESDPVQVGFKKIIMKPYVVRGLNHVKGSFESVHGLIKSEWTTDGNNFSWDITIPANTTAEISVPATKRNNVTESNKKANEAEGVQFIRMDGNRAVYSIGSGRYHFVSKDYK